MPSALRSRQRLRSFFSSSSSASPSSASITAPAAVSLPIDDANPISELSALLKALGVRLDRFTALTNDFRTRLHTARSQHVQQKSVDFTPLRMLQQEMRVLDAERIELELDLEALRMYYGVLVAEERVVAVREQDLVERALRLVGLELGTLVEMWEEMKAEWRAYRETYPEVDDVKMRLLEAPPR